MIKRVGNEIHIDLEQDSSLKLTDAKALELIIELADVVNIYDDVRAMLKIEQYLRSVGKPIDGRYFSSRHDQIWFGDAEDAPEELLDELDKLNWFIDEDSFSTYT